MSTSISSSRSPSSPSPLTSAVSFIRRAQSRSRPSPEPVAVDDRDECDEDEEDDSPHSAPHMSISLFLDGDIAHSAARPPSSSSPSRAMQPSASQPLSSSPSPSSSALLSCSMPACEPTTELYFQSGDVIFVVPPPPTADYTSIAAASPSASSASPSAQPANSSSLSLNGSSSSLAAVEMDQLTTSPSLTVLYPSAHLVHVYVLPSLSCISTLRGHDSCVEQVYRDEWCDASDQVITQTALGSVYVWSLSTGELLQRMEARSEWLSAFLMTRRLFPLPALSQVSALVLDDNQLPAASSHSMDDEDDVMLSGVSACVCLYENQRWFPLLGWSSKLLPTDRPSYSNAKGTRELSKRQFKLLPRWRWTSGWEVLRDDTTDVDGWSYAMDFSTRKGEYRGFHRKAFIHSVRRRKWVRHRQTMHEPTAEALASATLDDYIEHKQSTPLLLPPPTDSPQLTPSSRSLSHSPPQLSVTLSDKPSRTTPLLSPTPIKTRSRKSKTARRPNDHLLATDEPRVLTRPTSRSNASDQEPPPTHLSVSHSPTPRSAHVLPVSSSTTSTAASSTTTSPSLPSPKARRRHASATSRDSSKTTSTSSSPPVSPSTFGSVLSRVKVELQPSSELKQSLKRMLLSHNGSVPAKAASPALHANSSSNASASPTPASSTRPKAARSSGKVVRVAGNEDEQKERISSSSLQASSAASTAAEQYSKLLESKEADTTSSAAQRVKETQATTKKEQRQTNEPGAAQPSKEAVRRKKPISYNTLPSPPRSGSEYSFPLPPASSVTTLPPSPTLSPASPPSQPPSKAIRVEVWEHQRVYPVLGWSSRLLPTDPYPPFSDSTGHVSTFEMCELLLALDMDWLNDWTVRRSADTDAEGWQYAVDWSWEWSSKQRVLTTVRRRCWWRDKALRRNGPNMEGSKQERAKRRKQRMTTLPAALQPVGKRRGNGSSGNSGMSHSRSQSLYAPAALPLSSSAQSLSSLVLSANPSSVSSNSQPRRLSLSDNATVEHVPPPAYYDPSAGEPEEL